jgi:hypothetical protein
MKGSWLRYLGLLGFLGLLSLVTQNVGFAGFFGFFGFFAYSGSINDERFEANANRATRNAFISAILIFAVVTPATVLLEGTAQWFAYAFAGGFALQLFVFTISLAYFEHAGSAE